MKNSVKKKIAAVCIILQFFLVLGSISGAAQPTNPLIIYGLVYDKHDNPIGNVQVTLKNTETGEQHVNNSPVTAADGYQFNLGNFNQGWQRGDIIRINSSYQEGGHTYIESYEFPIPVTIEDTGYVMDRPLRLDNCIDCDGTDDDDDGIEKPIHYYINGIIFKQNGEPASGALVIVKNMMTGEVEATTTAQNGSYEHDLVYLETEWQYRDNIRLNATYGSGENYQIGYYDFKILHSLKNKRQVNIQMYQTFQTQQPDDDNDDQQEEKTKEEWIADYYELRDTYNLTQQELNDTKSELETLQNQSTNTTEQNHTQEEWDKIQWEIQRLRRTVADNNTIIILLTIIASIAILYGIWRNDLLPLPLIGRYSERR